MDFQRMMLDAEIFVARIANIRINNMNAVLETVQQMLLTRRESVQIICICERWSWRKI